MRRSCLGILALIIVFSGCGGSGSGGGNTFSPFFPGKWSATIVSPSGLANLDMNLVQTGSAISSDSTNTTDNLNCGNPLDHMDTSAGTLKGDQFNLVFTIVNETITITGIVNAGGRSVIGTFTSSGGPCLNGDSGTFTAASIPPVTGMYTGTMTSTTNAVSGVTAMLSEDASFNVSVSMMITNNTCFSSLATVAPDFGMSVGDLTVFSVTDGTNIVDFLGRIGQVNNSPTEFAGNWFATGNCTVQGTVQMNAGTAGVMRALDVSGASTAEATAASKISPLMVERLKALLAARREK